MSQPQLAYAINRLSVYGHQAPDIAYAMIGRVYRHLREERGLFFPANVDPKSFELSSYSDSDFGNCRFTRKSRNGEIHMLTGPIHWNSRRQSTVALSTMDAEVIALSNCTRTAIAVQSFLRELNVPIAQPTVIHEDNRGSIIASTNGLGGPRSRHLDIKHHYVVEQVREKRIAVRYIPSNENLADVFTKPLATPQFRALVDQFTVKLDDYLKHDEDSIPSTGPASSLVPPVSGRKKKAVKKKPTTVNRVRPNSNRIGGVTKERVTSAMNRTATPPDVDAAAQ